MSHRASHFPVNETNRTGFNETVCRNKRIAYELYEESITRFRERHGKSRQLSAFRVALRLSAFCRISIYPQIGDGPPRQRDAFGFRRRCPITQGYRFQSLDRFWSGASTRHRLNSFGPRYGPETGGIGRFPERREPRRTDRGERPSVWPPCPDGRRRRSGIRQRAPFRPLIWAKRLIPYETPCLNPGDFSL